MTILSRRKSWLSAEGTGQDAEYELETPKSSKNESLNISEMFQERTRNVTPKFEYEMK